MQRNRLLALLFPDRDAPCDILVVNRFEGEEHLSRDFSFVIEILSDNAKLDPKDFTGKLISVQLLRNDSSFRYFNGYIFSFRLVRTDGGIAYYEAEVGPWLRYLTQRKNNRLFRDLSVGGQTAAIFQDTWRGNGEEVAWIVRRLQPGCRDGGVPDGRSCSRRRTWLAVISSTNAKAR